MNPKRPTALTAAFLLHVNTVLAQPNPTSPVAEKQEKTNVALVPAPAPSKQPAAMPSEEKAPKINEDLEEVDRPKLSDNSPNPEPTNPPPINDPSPSSSSSEEEDAPGQPSNKEQDKKPLATDEDDEAHLDKTGTPPLPPQDNEEPRHGEWKKDYDGRKDPTGADEVLIWIPRAPLYPVHLVLNYGLRWPVVTGVAKAEEAKLFERIEEFFTFADGKAGIYPTAFYDAGRGFAAGLNFFYNDLGQEGHNFRVTAGIGTNNWITAKVKDSWKVFPEDRGTLEFEVAFTRDPTFALTGLGPDTDIDDQVFFSEEKFEVRSEMRVALHELNRFTIGLNFRRARLGNGRDPSIEELDFDTSELTGFEDEFFIGALEMKLDLDSRAPKSKYVAGSGIRLESWGNYHNGPGSTPLSFFRYGIRPTVLWDITGANHVLSTSLYMEALSRTGGEDVPLNELVTLGGLDQLKGFYPGRFRGKSALVHSIDYSWPLLAFADALLFTELGTTFNGFYEDFAYKKMVLDWGVGLRTTMSPEVAIWGAVAFATNQLEHWNDDFNLDNVRFVVGVTRAF